MKASASDVSVDSTQRGSAAESRGGGCDIVEYLMAHYGFAIDLRKCIGCHACTIACKAEHEIPIGVNRCWVKTVEKGTFPDTRRFFFPVLCNQCDDAPCVNICPTSAL